MNKNDFESIYKILNRTIIFYKNKKKKWKLLKKKSQLQIQKNFSVPNMASMYMKNWIF